MQSANGDTENNIPILYEDEGVLVVNKPVGLIVHSDGRNEESSLADWILKKYPELESVGEPWVSPQGETIARPGIVHRLDRTTSGVMVIAKTQDAFEHLKQQFKDRTVEKKYNAFVYGQPKADEGVIEAEIGRTKKKPRKWIATFAHGKKRVAITHWRVLHRFEAEGELVSFLELQPKTGRTHQLRVHLKAIHHPIVCDHIYAQGKPCLLGFERPALHARSLTFALENDKKETFEAPFPHDFEHALSFVNEN